MNNLIFFITGTQASGKTTFLSELINHLRERDISIGGILAHGFWKDNIRDGFELEDLLSGEKIVLSQTEPIEGWEKFRRFYFNPQGFRFGNNTLSPSNIINTELIAIDEIGPFELQGKGWRKAIDKLLKETTIPMIWVCRESVLNELVAEFDLLNYHICNISKETPENLSRVIIKNLI